MLTYRLSALFVVVVMAAFVLLRSDLITTTSACPPPPPQPLRVLYTQSDRIVVARVGDSVPVEAIDSSILVRTTLEVSSTVKGEGTEPVVQVYHRVWEGQDTYVHGDTLLVFLQRDAEKDGYQVDNSTYGVKKLPQDDLKIYLQRIDELAAILRQEEPQAAEIVEWFVRCAEETATRWEGAFELATSANFLKYRDESSAAADNEAEPSEDGEPSEDAESGDDSPQSERSIQIGSDEFIDHTWVTLLTDEQKNRLRKTFYGAAPATNGYSELAMLISTWGDERLIPFLVSYLRQDEKDSSDLKAEIVWIVASILDDESIILLAELAVQYQSFSSQDKGDDEEDEQNDREDSNSTIAQSWSEALNRFLEAVEKKIAGGYRPAHLPKG